MSCKYDRLNISCSIQVFDNHPLTRCQKANWRVDYNLTQVAGSDHCPVFRCIVTIKDEIRGQADSGSKNEAKKKAAELVLANWNQILNSAVQSVASSISKEPLRIAHVYDPNIITTCNSTIHANSVLTSVKSVAIVLPETNVNSQATRGPSAAQQMVFEDLLKLNKTPTVSDIKATTTATNNINFVKVDEKCLQGYAAFLDERRIKFLLSLADCPISINPRALQLASIAQENHSDTSTSVFNSKNYLLTAHEKVRNNISSIISLTKRFIKDPFSNRNDVHSILSTLGFSMELICEKTQNIHTCLLKMTFYGELFTSQMAQSDFSSQVAEARAILNLLYAMIVANVSCDHICNQINP